MIRIPLACRETLTRRALRRSNVVLASLAHPEGSVYFRGEEAPVGFLVGLSYPAMSMHVRRLGCDDNRSSSQYFDGAHLSCEACFYGERPTRIWTLELQAKRFDPSSSS